jgi:lysophospholipase L1-like esterase
VPAVLRSAAVLVSSALILALAAWWTPASAYSVVGPSLAQISVVVALGDSVPYGTNCSCVPYPQQSASQLHGATGRTVRTYDDAVPGARSSDVLTQVRTSAKVIAHLRVANVVEIEVGANDVGFTGSCGLATSCYAPRVRATEVRVAAIVARVRALTRGRPVAIVLLGYWNVWLDGRLAAAKGPAYVATSRWITRTQNAGYLSLARSTGLVYVDAWRIFRGTADSDDTRLLASDGDHPNALGHWRLAIGIAHALETLLPE